MNVKVQEIWFKTQRVLRTIVQVVTSFLAVWAGFVVVAPEVLAELAKILPGPWIVWLTAAIASVSAVAGVIARIMAIPRVNEFLTRFGLGSVPRAVAVRSAVVEAHTADGGRSGQEGGADG